MDLHSDSTCNYGKLADMALPQTGILSQTLAVQANVAGLDCSGRSLGLVPLHTGVSVPERAVITFGSHFHNRIRLLLAKRPK